jgi:hypothetical protein
VKIEDRRQKTYNAIMERPTRVDIRWVDIIDLLKSRGCRLKKQVIETRVQLIFTAGSEDQLLSIYSPRSISGNADRPEVEKLRVFLGKINKLKQ